MGRKRWWKGGLELLVLCFLHGVIRGDGKVGCLFSKNVCRSGVEACYDDAAFGTCIRIYGPDEEEVYTYVLDSRELELLRRQLKGLVVGGYEWTHPYTQCVMQASLYSLRYRREHDVEFCRILANLDERNIDEYGDDIEPEEDPQPLAVVNFTPTRGHGYGDFADEKYYPPVSSKKPKQHINRKFSDDPEDDYTYAYTSSYRKKPEHQRISKFEESNGNEETSDNDDILLESPEDSMNVNANLDEVSKNFRELAQRLNVKYEQPMYRLRRQPYKEDNSLRSLKSSRINVDYANSNIPRNKDENVNAGRYRRWKQSKLNDDMWKFIMMNATMQKRYANDLTELEFMKNKGQNDEDDEDDRWINRDNDDEDGDAQEDDDRNISGKEDIFSNQGMHSWSVPGASYVDLSKSLHKNGMDVQNDDDRNIDAKEDIFSNQRTHSWNVPGASYVDLSQSLHKNGMYTEGGLVQPIGSTGLDLQDVIEEVPETIDPVIFNGDGLRLLWNRDLGAFQRPERLDVKKPGPFFSMNNYAFKTQSPVATSVDDEESIDRKENEVLRAPLIKKEQAVNSNGQKYDNVDLDYVYIDFDSDFGTWADGERAVAEVAKLLGVNKSLFKRLEVGRAGVTFEVTGKEPNDANGIASRIDGIMEDFKKATGMAIISAGIGNKVKLPPSVEVLHASRPMSRGLFAGLVLAGAACAAAAAVVTLIIARKHAKSRAKLAGLATPDPEASKDYQDLCRVRMQAKQPSEKPESPRIISLSRESESNRSSTSSWGEEAAALTNMDISTGHMVLSYMEDHLKNKDRLDQEWAAICAYEADPSSVAIATEKSNVAFNRSGSSLPYDHSRVVLNDLSNANNSDYINASTITDHDPRNPAYIATQGPLPQTSADFWQLVWEQGSVVIVMLTRLTEEGRGMCHRYWPEEGSELYHIYEVHLVSEHIWCDDYLVRSFYLKNLRTGETRTVTQFHFLSWPENGVPQSTKALLEFRRKVNKSYRGRSCPIVVHCSDGAGRTGTYCLIDMVLNRMAKGAKEIDIAAALEHIRDQRPGMVATKQQFEFVLVAVAEEVHAILKALPVQTITEKSQSAAANTGGNAQSSSGSEQ